MNDHALKHGAAANLAKLPELCYSVDPADPREVVVIKAGVKGYYPAYRRDTPEAGQLLADQLNKQMNVTKAVEMAMLSGSMFGWHVPGADPATWEEKLTRAGK